DALFLLVILAGLFQVVFGLLRFGRLTRFISFSVMTGFVSGIAVVLALSQLPTVTGHEASAGGALANAIDVVTHLGDIHWATLAVAAATVLLGVGLTGTPLKRFATLVALIAPSIVVALAGLDSVQTVGDIGDISGGIPLPA